MARTASLSSSRSGGRGAPAGAVADRAARETSCKSPAPANRPGEHRGIPRVQVGLACERGIQRLQLLSRLHQQCQRIGAQAGGERDLPAQQVGAGLPKFIQRPLRRKRKQFGSRIERAGLQARLPGCQRPLGPADGFARQLDRALQECRRCGHAAAGLCPAC
jgi:hypothetical protein